MGTGARDRGSSAQPVLIAPLNSRVAPADNRPVRLLLTRITRASAVAALLLGAAGCGSSSGGSGSSSAASKPAAQAAATPSTAAPAAQYAAFAAAVNLRAGDVPGYVVKPKAQHERGGGAEHCIGGHEAKPLVKAPSPDFTAQPSPLEYKAVSSTVEVERSATVAESEITRATRAIANPATRSCLERELLAAFVRGVRRGGAGMSVSSGATKLAPVQLASTGGVPAVGFTASVPFTLRLRTQGRQVSIPLPVYLDAFAFASGRAVVGMFSIRFEHQVDAAQDTRLYSTLLTRARAARSSFPAVGS
jgi:hypothetical protein